MRADAQTTRVDGGVRMLSERAAEGFEFYGETRLVPPVPPLGEDLAMLTITSGGDTVHRVMIDRSQKLYFGYDVRVTVMRTEAGTRFAILFGPLSFTPELQKRLEFDPKTWKTLSTPRFPAPRVIRGGEVLELTLLTNSGRGQQLTEYITVQEPRRVGFDSEREREFAYAVGTPRDFTAADVELRLEEPRVTAGVADTIKSRNAAGGPIVWVYVPNRGRFLLSLTPRPQFRRSGDVRGTSLRFTVDGQTYDIVSATRIAPATAAFNLYVLHQSGWKPSYPNANLDTIHIGSADRLEYLGKQ